MKRITLSDLKHTIAARFELPAEYSENNDLADLIGFRFLETLELIRDQQAEIAQLRAEIEQLKSSKEIP